MDNPQATSFPVSQAEILLSLLERDSRTLYEYVKNPPSNFSPEMLVRHVSRMFAVVEDIQALATAAREEAGKSQDANGEQVN